MADEVTLTFPAEEGFQRVAHLVLGGLAVRLDLTFEMLEDLQLALDGLLDRCPHDVEVTVAVTVDDGLIRTSVGPVDRRVLDELERKDNPLGLRRVLETVCDRIEVEERDGRHWIALTKSVKAEA